MAEKKTERSSPKRSKIISKCVLKVSDYHRKNNNNKKLNEGKKGEMNEREDPPFDRVMNSSWPVNKKNKGWDCCSSLNSKSNFK